jgi:hypothetical protein
VDVAPRGEGQLLPALGGAEALDVARGGLLPPRTGTMWFSTILLWCLKVTGWTVPLTESASQALRYSATVGLSFRSTTPLFRRDLCSVIHASAFS